MTVPVTGNTNITRADATATFKTQITDPVNALPKWHAGSNPGGANVPLGGLSSASPALLNTVVLNTTTVSLSPIASEVALGNVSAGALGSLLQTTAIVLSRARNVRLQKYYNNTVGAGNYIFYDQTNIAHLSPAYQLGATGVPNPSGNLSASAFNTFVTQLQTAVTNHRNSTILFVEQWCHSSCHSSHSSRGRR